MIGARVLDRYVVREFTRLFSLFVLGTPLLFIIGDLTDNIDTFMDKGLTFRQIGLGYVYQFPQFMMYSFPIAALIATIFTVGNMTRHSEMSAAKASGISFYRVLATLPLIGIVLTVVGLGLTEIVPIGQSALQRIQARDSASAARQSNGRTARTDFVYRSAEGYVYAIRFLDVERRRIDGLTVHRQGDEKQNATISIVADEATYDDKKGWVLRNGYERRLMGPQETGHAFSEKSPGFMETPDELLAEPKEPDEMRYAEMGQFIETMKRSGAEPLELMVQRAQKIAIPVATLLIILFAAPLANSSARGGPAYGIGISLGITVMYLMALRLSAAAGATGAINTDLAAWLPNIALFVAALALLTRVRT